jgi:RNA polymerase sigma-70 factor (ECF subfamily)
VDERDDATIILESLRDPVRFAAIFERHYEVVYRYAAFRVGAEVGGEVASEVFVRAFEARHRFRVEAVTARPWLLGIAANLVRDHFRRAGRFRRATAAAAGRDPRAEIVGFEDVDSRVDAAAVRPRLAEALREMRPADREALFLHVLGGLTQREVAQALGLPLGTVQSRLFRARSRIRNRLRGIGESESGGAARDNGQ